MLSPTSCRYGQDRQRTATDSWNIADFLRELTARGRHPAIVAIDNIACGPAIGGVRMAPDVSTEEAFRLARTMTFKNAAAGLPHGGGGRPVIFAEVPLSDKERLIRAFAAAIDVTRQHIGLPPTPWLTQ